MALGGIAYAQKPADTLRVATRNYELLIVKRAVEGNSLYIYRQGQEVEFVQMPPVNYKESEVASMKLRQQTFSRLYKEGWRLVATQIDSSVPEYYFEREIL
jgi:hypothetical protein